MPSSWVEPAGPIQACIVRCSTLDNLTASVYPSPTHFFPLKPGTDPRQLYEDCKQGLSRCIYEHPHLSGVLVKDETGRNAIEIQKAPYAGTRFWYQDHRENSDMPSYQELKNSGWPFWDGEQDGLSKLRPRDFPTLENGDPIIAPQFNVVRGGIVLTMSIAHVIGDLVQFITFVRSWAQNTKIVSSAREKGFPTPPLPEQIAAHLVDRSKLTPDVAIAKDLDKLAAQAASLPHLSMLDPRYPEDSVQKMMALFSKARLTDHDLVNFPEDELRAPSCSVWNFSQSSIEELHSVIQKELPGDSRVSSTDCLTAFVWNKFSIVKHAWGLSGPIPVPETTRIVFAGNVRRRLTPPLPEDYMPACVDLFPVVIKFSEFNSSDPDALAAGAQMIRDSNNNWNEKAFHGMLEVAQSHPVNPGLIPNGPIDALVTDHTRASAAVLESWGPVLGQCEGFREPYLGRTPPLGEITLLPRWHDGSVDVMFAGEAVVMKRLRCDKSMNRMASCQYTANEPRFQTTRLQRLSRM
ncbi:hypothetical protein NW762_014151 [Fusarium torreyae]|uniref:Trichothecene 3-O-acetyltransferase-like N-terminal domain-containing protein n=1 Tax=Fusarium torreyae TaxID=1237075 RepID=A0A9W8V736_9HYPO|nr:hypothetical protein NW762_014151 [Fusarium torreyae]